MIGFATFLVNLLGLYATLGLAFSIPFLVRGVGRIDPLAASGSWGFRLIILPGVVVFWPWLLGRWVRSAPPPEERNPHRRAAR